MQKPTMIVDYNTFMGGVDKADQLVTYYGFSHHSKKWWKRPFVHSLDTTIVNAYLLYCSTVRSTSQRLTHVDFRLSVAMALIEKSELPSTPLPQYPQDATHLPARLIGREHFPEPGSKQDCKVCSRGVGKKRKQTNYQCCTCKVPLCIHPCFKIYHTHKNYK